MMTEKCTGVRLLITKEIGSARQVTESWVHDQLCMLEQSL